MRRVPKQPSLPRLSAGARSLLALAAREARGPLYVVGGALRDAFLGRPVLDLDLATASPRPLAQALAAKLRRKCIVLDEGEEVFRIIAPEGQLDVARLKGPTIEQDLARRDFTIDAMAAVVPSGAATLGPLLDPFGGRRDLDSRLVRAVSESAFREDPLRLLRAYRLASQMGFTVEPRTSSWIRRDAALIRKPAGERLHDELLKLLEAGDSAAWLRAMDGTRLLTSLVPELEPSRRCARVYYGTGGVLKHSLACVERLDFLLQNLDAAFKDLAPDIRRRIEAGSRGPVPLAALLRLGALLHDVAKPATAKRIGGRLRFFGHEEQGAEMSGKILERLRFSSDHKALLAAVIGQHLRPGNLAANPTISDRAVYRFFQDLGGRGVELLLVCWADHASYLTPAQLRAVLPHAAKEPGTVPKRLDPDAHKTLRHLQVVSHLLRQNYRRPDMVEPPRLADGNDVMRLLGLPPGPKVGEALSALREALAEGRVRTRGEALAFLKKRPS